MALGKRENDGKRVNFSFQQIKGDKRDTQRLEEERI